MNFGLSDEQELLIEAARGALGRAADMDAIRAAIDGAELPDLWPLAQEAGWPGLLVPEERGGAGLGVFEALLVAVEVGRVLAPVPIFGHLAAALLLSGSEAEDELIEQLTGGEKRAAYLPLRPPSIDRQKWHSELERVADVAGSDYLITGQWSEREPTVAVYKTEDASVEAYSSYDPTRPLAKVSLDGIDPVAVTATSENALAQAWFFSQALLAAEALGASESCLEMAVAYAKERFTFGRPIGSYQAIKHKLVEVLRRNENLRSLIYYVGYTAEAEPDQSPLAASAARECGITTLDYASRANIAVHGGIGATFEHDAPLYFRKAQLSRRLLGGAHDGAERLGELLLT